MIKQRLDSQHPVGKDVVFCFTEVDLTPVGLKSATPSFMTMETRI
jgi:hypothetical protein